MSLDVVENSLGVCFDDMGLLSQALTHSSALNEDTSVFSDNQRLEFLGDSVLSLVITDHLITTDQNFSEGEMSSLRSKVVSGRTLAIVARRLELGDHMIMGRGEENTGGREKDSNLADCLEALIGAVYLEKGWNAAKSIISTIFAREIHAAISQNFVNDPKGELQKLSHAVSGHTPVYMTSRREGPDHAPVYRATVSINGKLIAEADAIGKSDAERESAFQALEKLA